ncbi:erythromycin esterase [Glomus cerebriforme]|uniref:Erythromycin esterase n=1 Tax=Glomus cerebriforme TaxID=658196 RepID=A0A397SFG1_9GLOM|nr:erythromycin esterase [Glomus cerebriforme]
MPFGKEQSINRDLIKKHIIKLYLDNPKKDYDNLIESIGNAQVVLIGEASHGTEEFYHERCLITQRLIKEKDFTVVACEADWPDTFKINRYVQNFKSNDSKNAREALSDYQRFPTWMWRNYQIAYFVEWLKKHNDELEAKGKTEQGENRWNRYDKTGFYGLDLYSLFRSMDAVINYLEGIDVEAAERAKKAYSCFDHFDQSAESYSFSTYFQVSSSCEKEVVRVLIDMVKRRTGVNKLNEEEIDELFAAEMNAVVVKNSEEYYRTMIGAGAQSWNKRDSHMMKILISLMKYLKRQRDKPIKAVVWAHNSHVGDARQTAYKNELNIGQLAREQFGMENVYNIGFTTHTGTEKKKLPTSEELINELANKARLRERAIGVIYRPDTELQSHYLNAKISLQFDAVIHIDITSALKALPDETEDKIVRTNIKEKELPETFPAGE